MYKFDFQKELAFYRNNIKNNLLPFWERYMDHVNGGVFTCITNDGSKLVSTDKYVWSQGRFVWILSKLADLMEKGVLNGDRESYLKFAHKTCLFVKNNAILDDGGCAYLLTEDGIKKEAIASKGYHTSVFVDCFVAAGFAEYARVSGDTEMLEDAIKLYDYIEKTIQSGFIPAEPFPIPDGFASQAIIMIMTNVSYVLGNALDKFNHQRTRELFEKSAAYANEVLTRFCREDYTIREFININGINGDTLLERHTLPGHSLECMWFVLLSALNVKDYELVRKALKVVVKSVEIGWDEKYGGLLRYVDKDGGKPKGREIGAKYETLIKETWDSKLWWPHSEGLYTTLLSYMLFKDDQFLSLYNKISDYTFKVFPNTDKSIGEWIQIRDRKGKPYNKLVALPVKDPYHIFRNMLLITELLYNNSKLRS